MELKIGSRVMYSAAGVCRLTGIETKCPDGIHETEYYRLEPTRTENRSVYFIPVSTASARLRPLITPEQAYALIDSIGVRKCSWCTDRIVRKNQFHEMLKSDDPEQLICMVQSLHEHQTALGESGKKLSPSDEAALRSAEQLLNEEFAAVLHMHPPDIPELVQKRLAARQT